MTEAEFKTVFDDYLSRTFANRVTVKTYRAAAHRLVLRLPPEAWCDGRAVQLYRLSLSQTMRTKLGSVLHHVGQAVREHGIGMVDYATLRYQFAVPETMADTIDTLTVATSFERLAGMTWGGVPALLDTLGERERGKLLALMEYVWGEEEPDPAMPVVPLTRTLRHVPMPADLMESVVSHLSNGWTTTDEKGAFLTYHALCDRGVALADIEEAMGWFTRVDADVSRHDRPRAFSVATAALQDLMNDDMMEFVAKWNAILLRLDKKELDPDDRYRWFRGERPPTDGSEVTVSIGPVEVEDDTPRRFGTMSDPVEEMPEWRKALKTSNEWLHKVIAKS